MEARKYSEEIAKVIDNNLKAHELHYEFDEEEGTFEFGFVATGKLKSIDLECRVFGDAFRFMATSDAITADETDKEEMAKVAEYIARVNYRSFQAELCLNYKDGSISSYAYTDCDNCLPSDEVVTDAIIEVKGLLEDYGPGLLQVLYGGAEPEAAFDACVKALENAEKKTETSENA